MNSLSSMSTTTTQVQIPSKKANCHICNKTFSNSSNLKIHIRTIHQKILPFKCTVPNCNKKYPNKSRLNVHLRTHSGIKPYICYICKKAFNESGNLKAHYLKHDDKKNFHCPYCHRGYKAKGHLKEHIDIVHNNVK